MPSNIDAVGHPGLEPGANGLRIHCSTIELMTRGVLSEYNFLPDHLRHFCSVEWLYRHGSDPLGILDRCRHTRKDSNLRPTDSKSGALSS